MVLQTSFGYFDDAKFPGATLSPFSRVFQDITGKKFLNDVVEKQGLVQSDIINPDSTNPDSSITGRYSLGTGNCIPYAHVSC